MFGMKNKNSRANRIAKENMKKTFQIAAEQNKKKEEPNAIDVLNRTSVTLAAGGANSKINSTKKILCAAFRLGKCTKGSKCKFSHDEELLKSIKEKLNVQSDENLNNNQNKPKQKNYTKIICKYFLQACETNHYGKFWNCPNGDKCIYVHHLPEGYVLEKDKKAMKEQMKEQEVDFMTIEEYIEEEVFFPIFTGSLRFPKRIWI